MYVFGGQGDDPQQAMDADGVRHRHWSELLWRLDLQTAQWHRHKPVVRGFSHRLLWASYIVAQAATVILAGG